MKINSGGANWIVLSLLAALAYGEFQGCRQPIAHLTHSVSLEVENERLKGQIDELNQQIDEISRVLNAVQTAALNGTEKIQLQLIFFNK